MRLSLSLRAIAAAIAASAATVSAAKASASVAHSFGAQIAIQVDANFSQAQPLAEAVIAAESAAGVGGKLLQALNGAGIDLKSRREVLSSCTDLLKSLIERPEQATLVRIALELGEHIPSAAADIQYFETIVAPHINASTAALPVFAIVNGFLATTLDDIERIFTSGSSSKDTYQGSSDRSELPLQKINMQEYLRGPLAGSAHGGIHTLLFADFLSSELFKWHSRLSDLANEGKIAYYLLSKPVTSDAAATDSHIDSLTGYGARLNFKRTDYVAIDQEDFAAKIKQIETLSSEDLRNVSLKAANRILKAKDHLGELRELSWNLPLYVQDLVKAEVDDTTTLQFARDLNLQPGVGLLWLNGMLLSPDTIEMYRLKNLIESEFKLMHDMQHLGFDPAMARKILTDHNITKNLESDRLRLDFREDVDDAKAFSTICWLNDIENDSEFEKWPKSLVAILEPIRPGQFHKVARNMYNVIFYIDLSSQQQIEKAFNTIIAVMSSRIPFRIGIIPQVKSRNAGIVAKQFVYLHHSYGPEASLKFIELLLEKMSESVMKLEDSTVFDRVLKMQPKTVKNTGSSEWSSIRGQLSFNDVETNSLIETVLQRIENMHERLSLTGEPVAFANGVYLSLENEDFRRQLVMSLMDDLMQTQIAISDALIDETDDHLEYFLRDSIQHYSRWKNSVPGMIYIDMIKAASVAKMDLEFEDKDAMHDLWIIADWHSDQFGKLVETIREVRKQWPITVRIISSEPNEGVCKFLKPLKEGGSKKFTFDSFAQDFSAWKKNGSSDTEQKCTDYTENSALYDLLHLEKGKNVMVLNGNLLDLNEKFAKKDMLHLLEYSKIKMLDSIEQATRKKRGRSSLFYAQMNSIIFRSFHGDFFSTAYPRSKPPLRRSLIDRINDKVGWEMPFSKNVKRKSAVKAVMILDPLAPDTQIWISIIDLISQFDGIELKIVLNPAENTPAQDLKSFFRFKKSFDDDNGNSLVFKNVPKNVLMNLQLVTPQSWLLTQRTGNVDLDNIIMTDDSIAQAAFSVAEYKIDAYLTQDGSQQTPAGNLLDALDLAGKKINTARVMAIKGYAQFRLPPGLYQLQSRSTSARLGKAESLLRPTKSNILAVTNPMILTGTFLNLSRRVSGSWKDFTTSVPEKIADRVHSMFRKFKGNKHGEINIFTLASGHLYERFILVMVRSVLEQTKSKVKFWFLDNYASPKFKVL